MNYQRIFVLSIVICFHTLLVAQGPALEWAEGLGSGNGDLAFSLAVDPSGNVVSTGYYRRMVDFDPGPGTYNLGNPSSNIPTAFVQKVDPNGQFVWARSIEGNTNQVGFGIETDAAGAVYVVGQFSDTCDFDPGPGTYYVPAVAGDDMFILKLNAAGNFCWVRTFSSSGISTDGAGSIARGTQNRMVIAGTIYGGSIDFDPGPGVAMVSYADSLNASIFLLCLDTAGNYSWARGIDGPGWDDCTNVKCDPSGNVYLTGLFTDTVDFDPGPGIFPLTSQGGNQNIFALKLDAAGNLIYADAFPGNNWNIGSGIACTATGEAILTGSFRGTTDFDPGPGTSNRTANGVADDVFICKLDAGGNLLWIKTIGGMSMDAGRTITTDLSGNIYFAGDFKSTIDCDPGVGIHPMTSLGAEDVFIEKLDSAGNFRWVARLGSAQSEYCTSIQVDAAFSVYTAGWFSGTADFDPSPGTHLLTPTLPDIFVQKYSSCSPGTTTISATSCYSYTLNNQTYTSSGNYTQTTTGSLGCDSTILLDLTIYPADTVIIADTACFSYMFNNQTYTSSGNYTQTTTGINGCDSVLVLHLTISTVDVSVTVNDPVITANATNATYQWINCQNGFPVVGDTAQSFTPPLNGTYAVIVTQGNCSDTSACTTIISLGENPVNTAAQLLISENPNQGTFTLHTNAASQVTICDVQGREVSVQSIQAYTPVLIHLSAPGVYMITATTPDGRHSVQRVIVTE